MSAKKLAHELGTNLSSCYYLLSILGEEGYIEKVCNGGGYRVGPAISRLSEASRSAFDRKIEPVVEDLARRTGRHAYAAVLSSGEMEVIRARVPPKGPPWGWGEDFAAPRTRSPWVRCFWPAWGPSTWKATWTSMGWRPSR